MSELPHVEVYTKPYCPYCQLAKRILDLKSVVYKEINLMGHPELIDDVRQRSGQQTVPQIFINGQSIGGHRELSALDEAGELDQLLRVDS